MSAQGMWGIPDFVFQQVREEGGGGGAEGLYRWNYKSTTPGTMGETEVTHVRQLVHRIKQAWVW